MALNSLTIVGCPSLGEEIQPTLVSCPKTIASGDDERVVECFMETSPLDGSCDARLSLRSMPIVVVFDSVCFF